MSDETNAHDAGGAISDDDLLTIIGSPGDYSAEVVDGARLEAQLRGLIGRFADAEYKTLTPDGQEHAHVDVVTLKGLYLSGFLNRDAPVYVASEKRWLPLAQVFDVSRWEASGETFRPQTQQGEPGGAPHQSMPPPTQTALRDAYLGAGFGVPQSQPLATSGALPPTTYANTAASATPTPAPPLYPEYKGVGGWLALFIVWQLACRPLTFCGAMASENARFPHRYPMASFILGLEGLLNFGTLLFGIIVGVALLRSTDESVVNLTKKYLLTLLGVSVFEIILRALTDLPWFFKGPALGQAISGAFFTGIYVLIWHQYFTKSKRVQATYLDENQQGGGTGFTTIGLGPKQP